MFCIEIIETYLIPCREISINKILASEYVILQCIILTALLALIFTVVVYGPLFREASASPSFNRQVRTDNNIDLPTDFDINITKYKGTIFLPYESSRFAIKILYPQGWKQSERDRFVVFTSNSQIDRNNPASLVLYVDNLATEKVDLEDFMSFNRIELKQTFSNITFLPNKSTTLAGNPAQKFEFIAKDGDDEIMGTNFLSIIRDKAYTITYLANNQEKTYSRYLPIVEKMVDSLKVANPLDLVKVSYLSDGKFLKGTYWLNAPFDEQKIFSSDDMLGVSFGMYIDTDLDQIPDYNFRISKLREYGTWNSTIWNNTLSEFEPQGISLFDRPESKPILVKHNFTGFFENGKRYINFSLELDNIGSPERYKVLFYSLERKGSIENIYADPIIYRDFTNWISIPQLGFTVTALQNPIELKQEESKTVQVRVNSTTGFQPQLYLSAKDRNGIELEFENNNITMPIHGVSTVRLKLSAAGSANLGPDTVPITAVLTIPPESPFETSGTNATQLADQNFPIFMKGENITRESSLAIQVESKMSSYETFVALLKDWGIIVGLVIGGAASQFWTLIFDRIKKTKKSD